MLQEKELRDLYQKGKSMMEISYFLRCSNSEVRYWMNKYNIPRRTHSEAAYIKQNPNGDPFKIKEKFSKKDMFLFGLGLGIYWGEGTKVSQALTVGNTDPELLKVFIKFMLQICNLDPKKIKYSIVSFNDVPAETARKYWSKQLKISPHKFGKITIIPHQGKGTYKRKSEYGVCTVRGNNIKLKNWMMEQLKSINNRI